MATVPNTNVNLATNVRDVLNSAGGSVSNDLTSFFKPAAKLNMWSKYKPVVATELFLDTDKRWQGADGKCGLTIPTYTSPSSFRTAARNGNAMWSYTPPAGGTTQPMRLGDFRGYNTDAYNPLGMVASNGILSNGQVTFAIDVAITGSSSTNLLLDDICPDGYGGTPLSEYYLGIYAWKDSSTYVFRTGTTKIGSVSSLEVSIPITTTGEWYFMPFLSSSVQGSTEQSGRILSVNKPAQKLTVVAGGTLRKVDAFGAWNSAKTKVVEISAFLTNATSSSVTFSGIKVELRRSTGTDPSAASLVSTMSYSGSVTVAANGTKTISISDISHTRADGYNYWLAAYATQTTSTTYNEIEDSTPED